MKEGKRVKVGKKKQGVGRKFKKKGGGGVTKRNGEKEEGEQRGSDRKDKRRKEKGKKGKGEKGGGEKKNQQCANKKKTEDMIRGKRETDNREENGKQRG